MIDKQQPPARGCTRRSDCTSTTHWSDCLTNPRLARLRQQSEQQPERVTCRQFVRPPDCEELHRAILCVSCRLPYGVHELAPASTTRRKEGPERLWVSFPYNGVHRDTTVHEHKHFDDDVLYARVHQTDDTRVEEIRKRWANIPPMDCGTSDTGKKCEAYLYEKDFPNTLIATMADLYDTSRLNALAKSKSDIDYLLSLLPQLSSSEYQRGVDAVVRRIQQRRDRCATTQSADAATIRMVCDRLLGEFKSDSVSSSERRCGDETE